MQRTRLQRGRLISAAILAPLLPLLSACSSGSHNFLNENDALRRENLELRGKIDQLQKNIDLRLAEIKTLQEQTAAAGRGPLVNDAEIPRAVALVLDRYSGALDTDHDGADDMLRLYVKPVDQQGRFLPVAGAAVVQAVSIQPDHPAVTLAELKFDAKAWDAAYRSGVTGTHYTLEVPLPVAAIQGISQATVKLTFTDAATGAVLTVERPVTLNR